MASAIVQRSAGPSGTESSPICQISRGELGLLFDRLRCARATVDQCRRMPEGVAIASSRPGRGRSSMASIAAVTDCAASVRTTPSSLRTTPRSPPGSGAADRWGPSPTIPPPRRCPVEHGIVGGGVGPVAVTDRLDQGRAPPARARRTASWVARYTAAYPSRRPSSRGSRRRRPSGRSSRRRSAWVGDRDGVEVVLAEEHGRGPPDPGEVETGVEVVLRGGPIAEVGDGDGASPAAGPHRRARRHGQCGSRWDADDPAPVAEHVPVGVGQTSPVGEDHLDRDAAGQLDAVLPVAG